MPMVRLMGVFEGKSMLIDLTDGRHLEGTQHHTEEQIAELFRPYLEKYLAAYPKKEASGAPLLGITTLVDEALKRSLCRICRLPAGDGFTVIEVRQGEFVITHFDCFRKEGDAALENASTKP
jgi:hypothetical protein